MKNSTKSDETLSFLGNQVGLRNRKKLTKNLQSILNVNTVNKNYNLRNKQDYQHKYVRTKQKQMCLSIYGIKL